MSLTEIILILIFIALMTIALTLFNILFDIRYWEYRKRFEKDEKTFRNLGSGFVVVR